MKTKKKSVTKWKPKKGVKKVSQVQCFKCRKDFEESLVTRWTNDPKPAFCATCYPSTSFQCTHCHKHRDIGEKAPSAVPSGDVCEYCYFMFHKECGICSKAMKASDGVEVGRDRFYCIPCSKDRYVLCYYCEVKVERESVWQKTDHGVVCGGCRRSYEQEMNPPPISGHGFKPKNRFYGTSPSKLFLGYELEVEQKRGPVKRGLEHHAVALREAITDEKGRPIVYIKHDGSLENGFEIVSHPMSTGWLRANHSKFDPIFELVRDKFVSHDSGRCGMHVHMSKAAFTGLHLYKFIQFFQRERDFILRVSQRGTEQTALDQYARIEYSSGGGFVVGPKTAKQVEAERRQRERQIMNLAKDKGGHGSRYQAVNLTPAHTVEVRIFRGTLKKERFLKNLEFCIALYEFTMINSLVNCKLEYFVGFVHRYRNEFPNLYHFLQERYKFKILRKNVGKKGVPKESIRYEGPRAMTSPDCTDGDWAERVAEAKRKRDARIAFNIQEAKKRKLADTSR